MKPIIVYLLLLISGSTLYGQSSIVYGSSTSLYVGAGADLCADTITINGTFSGGGTFCNLPVDVENEKDLETPEEFSLSQNYPNPFNPTTYIEFRIANFGFVLLKIYDLLGKEVATLVNEEKPAGNYEVEFDASNLSSGVYIYKLTAGEFNSTKKLILIK
jgi:hypothetical protein